MRTFEPSEISAATGGAISADDLRNWVRYGLFNAELPEPRAGKPRQFPYEAVLEAVLLREFSRRGVEMQTAKRWNAGIVERILKHGLAVIDKNGGQYGGEFTSPQVILFHDEAESPLILSDSDCGETLNRAFYKGRKGNGPAPSFSAIHLPALFTPINEALGV